MKRVKPVFAAILVVILCALPAVADIKWKTDYDDGMRQARLSGKAMLLWFMDRRVGWCSKFLATTLSNPDVVGFAGKFICLKIDRSMKPRLAEQYAVDKVSTTVFLDHRGKEITRIQGNVSVQEFQPVIEKVASRYGTPVRSREYLSAKQAMEMGTMLFDREQYGGAVVQFEWAKRFGVKTDGLDEKIERYLREIDGKAKARLDAAEVMLRDGKIEEGMKALGEVSGDFRGTECGRKAGELVNLLKKDQAIRDSLSRKEREEFAWRLLDRAVKAYKAKRYLSAYEGYTQVSTGYGRSAAGMEGARKLAKMESRRWVMSQVAKQRRDRECVRQMSLAESWVMNGEPQKAREILEQIGRKYSRTKLGREAKRRLAEVPPE